MDNNELKKAIDELRGLFEKQPDVAARIDAIEKAAQAREQSVKDLRKELDDLKKFATDRQNEIKEMQQKQRLTLMSADPVRNALEARAIFGMMMRENMARHLKMEIPERFRNEADVIKNYREQRTTLSAGAVTGSYLVPTIVSTEIIDALEEISDLMAAVDFMTDLPGNVNIPVIAGRPTMQPTRATIDTDMTASSPTFSQLEVTPKEAYVFFPVDNRLFEMSAIALGQLVQGSCRDGVLSGIASWLINADGTSAYNSQTGILKEATYVTSMAAGKKSFNDVDNAQLNKVLAAMLKRGRGRASYLMSQYVLGVLEELNREGKIPVITVGPDGTPRCKMKPILIDEDMPEEADDAPNTAFMAVGDMKAMLVGMTGGISVQTSTEYLFGRNQTAFRSVINMWLGRKPLNTMRVLKTANA